LILLLQLPLRPACRLMTTWNRYSCNCLTQLLLPPSSLLLLAVELHAREGCWAAALNCVADA